MSTQEVVKTVAKKLKYYFEIKRLEDGFDLSDVHQPILSHPPQKARPAHQYNGLHDRALKHYFSQPEIRVILTQLNSPNRGGSLQGWREIEVRKMLDSYMKHYSFQVQHLSAVPKKLVARSKKKTYHYQRAKPQATGILSRRKRKQKNISGGWPVLRTVPDQHISKAEAERLVNSATKIICGSEVVKLPYPYKNENKLSAMRLFQNEFSTSTGTRSGSTLRNRNLGAKQEKTAEKARPGNRMLPKQPRSRSTSPVQSARSSTSSYRSASSYSITSSSSSSSSHSSALKQLPAKVQSPTVINMPEQKHQEEVGVVRSTQTAADHTFDSKTGSPTNEKSNKEVDDGPLCEYQVYVSTGDRIGAGTSATVKLTLYGEKGRTKEFELNSLSKRHKIPFQKGNEDLFLLQVHHVGRLSKIQIGHDRAELNYAWYLENVTVYDMHAKRIYQFPCGSWLSGQGEDKKTYKNLHADSEREFIEASDMSMTKSALHEGDDSGAGSPAVKVRHSHKANTIDDISTANNPQDSSPKISSNVRIESEASRSKQIGTAQREQKDDYKQKATKIILHSMPGSKVVDEIFLETDRSTHSKTILDKDVVEEHKSPITEHTHNMQLEKEKESERGMLKNKTIHDAVRDGDIDRVKDLLHQFPEKKDHKDDKGWTPLHLAATSGNMEILRWLVTSEVDINAETPVGYTAMHITAMNGHVNAMMILQAMGASIFSLTKEKQSALHLAAKSGHLECVKWLVANRASLDAKDSSGNIAYRLADEYHHESCANFLRVCMLELSNPRSTFAQIHGRQDNGIDLPPIREDAISRSSGNAVKEDAKVEMEKKTIYAD